MPAAATATRCAPPRCSRAVCRASARRAGPSVRRRRSRAAWRASRRTAAAPSARRCRGPSSAGRPTGPSPSPKRPVPHAAQALAYSSAICGAGITAMPLFQALVCSSGGKKPNAATTTEASGWPRTPPRPQWYQAQVSSPSSLPRALTAASNIHAPPSLPTGPGDPAHALLGSHATLLLPLAPRAPAAARARPPATSRPVARRARPRRTPSRAASRCAAPSRRRPRTHRCRTTASRRRRARARASAGAAGRRPRRTRR